MKKSKMNKHILKLLRTLNSLDAGRKLSRNEINYLINNAARYLYIRINNQNIGNTKLAAFELPTGAFGALFKSCGDGTEVAEVGKTLDESIDSELLDYFTPHDTTSI